MKHVIATTSMAALIALTGCQNLKADMQKAANHVDKVADKSSDEINKDVIRKEDGVVQKAIN